MDLFRHLRYFLVVADELHFGRAAERLHISQSPLSQRIRALERTLDVELFTRTTRSVQLTPAGRVLLEEATAVLARVELMESTLHAAGGEYRAALRMGISKQVPATVLAEVTRQFAADQGPVQVEPVELGDAEQRRALVDRRIDLGFVRWPVPSGLCHGAPLAQPLGVLLAEDDPLLERAEPKRGPAARQGIELGRLGRQRAVVLPARTDSPDHHDALLRTCHAYGFVPSAVLSAARTDFAAALVLTNEAVALLEAPEVVPAGTVWRPLIDSPLTMRAAAVWRAEDRRTSVTDLAGLLREALLRTGRWSASSAPVHLDPISPRPADAFLG